MLGVVAVYVIAWALIIGLSLLAGYVFSWAFWVASQRHKNDPRMTLLGLVAFPLLGTFFELPNMLLAQAEGGIIAITISLAICIGCTYEALVRRTARLVVPGRTIRATN